jgi:hypothetical protein
VRWSIHFSEFSFPMDNAPCILHAQLLPFSKAARPHFTSFYSALRSAVSHYESSFTTADIRKPATAFISPHRPAWSISASSLNESLRASHVNSLETSRYSVTCSTDNAHFFPSLLAPFLFYFFFPLLFTFSSVVPHSRTSCAELPKTFPA